jgi:hypothetical protein
VKQPGSQPGLFMAHMLQEIPVGYQGLQTVSGCSVQHTCDMGPRMGPQLDSISAVMLLVAMCAELEPLVRRLGVDHPEVHKAAVTFFENRERQYDRAVLARALQKQDQLCATDIERLLTLSTLTAVDRHYLERLLDEKSRRGRPALFADPPKTFAQAFFDAWKVGHELWDPNTSACDRRRLYMKTRLWRRYIAAAYRGELREALKRQIDKSLPYLTASDFAKAAVADAAGITDRLVKEIYAEDEEKFIRNKKPDDDVEEMRAADLKKRLEG